MVGHTLGSALPVGAQKPGCTGSHCDAVARLDALPTVPALHGVGVFELGGQ